MLRRLWCYYRYREEIKWAGFHILRCRECSGIKICDSHENLVSYLAMEIDRECIK